MGEIIQYEGFDYRKVNRKAKVGDVVIPRLSVGLTGVQKDTVYAVVEDKFNNNVPHINANFGKVLVYSPEYGRTEDTVDVYERFELTEESFAGLTAEGLRVLWDIYGNKGELEEPTAWKKGLHMLTTINETKYVLDGKVVGTVPHNQKKPKITMETIDWGKGDSTAESEQDKLAKHLAHPFYKDAHTYRELTRHGQIVKGSEKYDEPFTPSSWTALELLQHAMQENVDQAHYIYGIYQKVQEMEKELAELRQFRDQVHKTVVKWGAVNEPESGNA